MADTIVRRFRQINRKKGTHEYLAKEVHFVEVAPGKIKSVIVFDDDTSTDGATVDEKIWKMNIDGFDVISTGSDGTEKRSHHVGMVESGCWEEIQQAAVPVEVTITVESPVEQSEDQKSA